MRNVGFKSAERLVHNLVNRVSKNGYLLLNIGSEKIRQIRMLGDDEALRWFFDEDGLQVAMADRVPSDIAGSLRIELAA